MQTRKKIKLFSLVNGGCTEEDYGEFNSGNIAIMDRGFLTDCSMVRKLQNAIAHNAVGVLVINDPDKTGLFGAGLEQLTSIPAFALTYTLGKNFLEMLHVNELRMKMTSNNKAPFVPTMNLLAETPEGDGNSVIVVGSHLDSVPAGPGINVCPKFYFKKFF